MGIGVRPIECSRRRPAEGVVARGYLGDAGAAVLVAIRSPWIIVDDVAGWTS